jgi:muramoyltetrapeptide carboxypeptidase
MSTQAGHKKRINLRLIYPASGDKNITPMDGKLELKNGELRWKRYRAEKSSHNDWNHLSATTDERKAELLDALNDPDADGIICGRGGYGASDLLRHLPWDQLRALNEKILIGFSDISALHSAFFTQLSWRGIHGPMPDSLYWQNSNQNDLECLFDAISQKEPACSMTVQTGRDDRSKAQGWLFGGCLSVLTNLIGTPYLPSSFSGSILFFEDVDEPAGRVFRNLNQWIDSGLFAGVEGIVLGRFSSSTGQPELSQKLARELEKRSGIRTWSCLEFGHCTPNMPLKIGATAQINGTTFKWHHKRSPFIGS